MENEKVNKLLDLLISGVEKGTEFANQNAGPLFEEYYHYELTVVFCWITLSVVVLALGAGLWCLGYKKSEEFLAVTGFFMCLVFVFVLLINLFDLGLALSNPKIWTLQQITHDLRR